MNALELKDVIGVFAFGLGACIASFLNVVIWRVPRGESIVSPPSHCPKCHALIKWYQNVPILAWLALRGKCANCGAPISPRYILVETLGGCLFLAAFLHLFGGPQFDRAVFEWTRWFGLLILWVWISLMIVGSMIDFDLKLLPDFVTMGGMVLGLVASLLLWLVPHSPSFVPPASFPIRFPQSLLGLAVGFGLLWLVRFLGTKAFRREAMGMGDVLLMGAVGALFGPVAVLVTLILSSVLGAVVGVAMIALAKTRLGRFSEIPFGPYICLGCLAWIFCGRDLVAWYLGLLGVGS